MNLIEYGTFTRNMSLFPWTKRGSCGKMCSKMFHNGQWTKMKANFSSKVIKILNALIVPLSCPSRWLNFWFITVYDELHPAKLGHWNRTIDSLNQNAVAYMGPAAVGLPWKKKYWKKYFDKIQQLLDHWIVEH